MLIHFYSKSKCQSIKSFCLISIIAPRAQAHISNHTCHPAAHGLRHTQAIMLLESNTDLKYVSERLSHTIVNMTADVYIHITTQ
ncbi:tyrosine-type recombinase/integrase [Bacillus vallismortis]|uniref:tyrosine-type recombinase/integrase n=1 Tax=Bacillus vallismortis TaxID=72361 RepID=UPI00374D23DD